MHSTKCILLNFNCFLCPYGYYYYTTGWQISKMWLAKASSISAKFEILTCKNYASNVKCEISLLCSINRKQHGFFGVFGINIGSWHFKTPQISLAAAAARDILVNFEISLTVFIPNTPTNCPISYTYFKRTQYWNINIPMLTSPLYLWSSHQYTLSQGHQDSKIPK